MNTNEQRRFPVGASLLAFLVGVVSCLTIAYVLSGMGLATFQAFVFAALVSSVIAGSVWNERKLSYQVAEKDRMLEIEMSHRMDSQNRVYTRSLACMVRFDAVSFTIDRVSPGFIKMLSLPSDTILRARRLEEVLGVTPLKLESVVESIKQGDSSVKQPKMDIHCANGLTAHALISGDYYPQEQVVEAAFFVPAIKNSERIAEFQLAQKDLDRFRKGMFRRETRILELKEEVNVICKQAGLPSRYQTDKSSDDSKMKMPAANPELVEAGDRVSCVDGKVEVL